MKHCGWKIITVQEQPLVLIEGGEIKNGLREINKNKTIEIWRHITWYQFKGFKEKTKLTNYKRKMVGKFNLVIIDSNFQRFLISEA